MTRTIYLPRYTESLAIVVGINNYQHVSPLEYARQDAEAVATTLKDRFAFEDDRITMLIDGAATRSALMSAFLRFAEDGVVSPDARLLVFFAGHGHTRRGARGEVGYLVPVDGNLNDLSSLIRWDDLTRNADLIPAKHVLFVMDACYGGLAATRAPSPGSSRFVKDMLQRYSRQVLTAGKADEVVADSGGPRVGHSMFTGHFLDALEGAAAKDNVISANHVMAYVYEKVAKDAYSRQSPHYSFLDGDGDLIFDAPVLKQDPTSATIDEDVLVATPESEPSSAQGAQPVIDRAKEYLSDPKSRIRLADLVRDEVRSAQSKLATSSFPTAGNFSNEAFLLRIRAYEEIVAPLQDCVISIAHWGSHEHKATLELPFSRLAEDIRGNQGLIVWIGLRWFPIVLLMYSAGVAAIASDNYANLAAVLRAQVQDPETGSEPQEVAVVAARGILDVGRAEVFKNIPGHERHYTPESEYLFKTAQPKLEDALFLGTSYEQHFDRFEILYALTCADFRERRGETAWGPVGRFGWKQSRGYGKSPFDFLVEEAAARHKEWAPLKAGLFAGSYDRFKAVADGFRAHVLGQLRWH